MAARALTSTRSKLKRTSIVRARGPKGPADASVMAWYRSPWTACLQFIYEAKEDEAAADHNEARLDRVDCLVFDAWVCITWARGHVVKEGHSRGRGCLNWMCAFRHRLSCCGVNCMGVCPLVKGEAFTPTFPPTSHRLRHHDQARCASWGWGGVIIE